MTSHLRTRLTLIAALAFVGTMTGCSDDDPAPVVAAGTTSPAPTASAAPTPEPSTSEPPTSEPDEEINPCSPDAPAAETGLEGDPAAPGAPVLDVVAVDHEFEGVPATLPRGPHGFRLVGEGREFHELALVRFADGETRELEELLELDEAEQEKAMEYLGGVTACPGTTSPEALGVDLTPGQYAMICFVPVGTTPDLRGADLAAAYENEPHFTQGMTAEFTVR